ncbi:hypothetical protein JCM19236_3192 [Vibrio sp. JCM 19236]|nr:hypothetical protein JCM19236_3192 [Vibrio sp. JCM 19236]
MSPKEVVLAYWQAMQSNDFAKASEWLSPDFECYWPQSKELILGRDKFIALNSSYPAKVSGSLRCAQLYPMVTAWSPR